MKHIILSILFVCLAVPALADNVTIVRREGDVVHNLPGNSQVITNPDRRDAIIINGDNDVWERVLLGPRVQIYAPNYGRNNGGVNSMCPPSLSVSARNKCVREYIKIQEKYN